MAEYIVKKGDSLSKIAKGYSITWQEIYMHPNNDEFRKRRPDPDLIEPGDLLWVPDNVIMPTDREVELLDDLDESDKHIDPLLLIDSKNLHKHKVLKGQTLESIAQALGCDWREIAVVNWGTDDESEINWYLENFVGCKSPNGPKTEFDGFEYPGILLLPKMLKPKTSIQVTGVRVARRRVESA